MKGAAVTMVVAVVTAVVVENLEAAVIVATE